MVKNIFKSAVFAALFGFNVSNFMGTRVIFASTDASDNGGMCFEYENYNPNPKTLTIPALTALLGIDVSKHKATLQSGCIVIRVNAKEDRLAAQCGRYSRVRVNERWLSGLLKTEKASWILMEGPSSPFSMTVTAAIAAAAR